MATKKQAKGAGQGAHKDCCERDTLRKIALAGIGAAVLAKEEASRTFDRLVEKGRGSEAEKICDDLLSKRSGDLKRRTEQIRKDLGEVRSTIENRVEKFIGKVNKKKTAETAKSD